MKESKRDRKVNCWSYGKNNFARDCTKSVKRNGDKRGKVNATLKDDDDENYGVISLPVS